MFVCCHMCFLFGISFCQAPQHALAEGELRVPDTVSLTSFFIIPNDRALESHQGLVQQGK